MSHQECPRPDTARRTIVGAEEKNEVTVGPEVRQDKLLVDAAGVRYLLDVGEHTSARMVREGGITEILLPSRGAGTRTHVRYSVEELSAWVAAGCPPARSWKRAWPKLRASRSA